MKRKVQLCSLDNREFLEGVIEELEASMASQATIIEELRSDIDRLSEDRDIWRKAVEDTVNVLLSVELPKDYKGTPQPTDA